MVFLLPIFPIILKPDYIESKFDEIMSIRNIPTWNDLFPINNGLIRGVSYHSGLVKGVIYQTELIKGVTYDD